jgi:hypothetical protein
MAKKSKEAPYVLIDGIRYTRELIHQRIANGENAARKALLAIFEYQTEQEKAALITQEANGVGFNGTDAHILSSFALQLQTKGWLSPKQMALVRKKMPKYSGQIFRILVEKRKRVSENIGI